MAHPFPGGEGAVPPLNTSEIQAQITAWQDHNFYADSDRRTPVDALCAVIGLGEEAGEVQRAVLKRHQGIRGTSEEWVQEAEKELGDVFIKMVDVAESLGIDLDKAILTRWLDVRVRDFQADSVGHGLPKD
jgi:NTP pyrophosphatase (non-canonical NTP hydrolase)